MKTPGKNLVFIADTDTSQRLDVWLTLKAPDLSRSRLQALIRAGKVTVDGAPAREHRRLKAGQSVHLHIPAPIPAQPQPQNIPLDILFQDSDIIVINKPPGMVVHPAAGHTDGTLVNALLFHCPDLTGIGGELRPGIVHRLDRDTSGVLVAAKNAAAMADLARQFKSRQVHKEYLALVRGTPSARGTIEAAIGRHPVQRKKMTLTDKGRAALTTYELVQDFGIASLIKLRIHTGRTHQIRVHVAHIGHPVLGDCSYGHRTSTALPVIPPRQMLHAARLEFTHPATGKTVSFNAPLPADMLAVITALQKITPAVALPPDA